MLSDSDSAYMPGLASASGPGSSYFESGTPSSVQLVSDSYHSGTDSSVGLESENALDPGLMAPSLRPY